MKTWKRPLYLAACMLVSYLLVGCSSGDFAAGPAPGTTFRGALALMKAAPDTRFAVLDFTDGAGSFTAYGKVVGDETFYRVSALKGIHLIERQKLGAILEEHRLEQSGLVSGDDRERLGRLLGVDILIMGSYVYEGDRVRVTGRYTDVKTGEIKGTFAYYLGEKSKSATGTGKIEEEPASCEPYEKMIEPYMRDLRAPAMVEKAVGAAITIPYTMKCRHVHREIMGTFARGGFYPERYVRFLHDSVVAIPDPQEMERKSSVFYYYQSDEKIDEREWNTGLLSMKNANERVIRNIVYFIHNRGHRQDEQLLLKRIDMLMGLSAAGAFGRPIPLNQDQMFQIIVRVGAPDETTRLIRLYLLEKYAPSLQKDKKNLSFLLSYSEKSLISETDRPSRQKFYSHIGALFAAADPEGKNDLCLQLLRFTSEMHNRHGKEDAAALRELSVKLSPWFCHAVTQVRRDYRLKSAVGVLQKYNIQCGP